MKFKTFNKGKLKFINVKANFYKGNDNLPKFQFGDNYHSSENFAIKYFESKGYNAFFAENNLWIILLISLFNDELKRKDNHQPELSNINHYLYDDDYFNENKEKYLTRFAYLKTVNLANEIITNFSNPSSNVLKLCEHVEDEKLLSILYDLIQDMNTRKKGFPDLFVYNNQKAFFCEVKGNADSLSYAQIKKHEVLLNNGIDVVLFSINKNKKWADKVKCKYFNNRLVRRRNFIDNYEIKIVIANDVYKELKNYGIDEFKNEFVKNYGVDAFIALLNELNNYSFEERIQFIKSPPSKIINKSVIAGEKLNEKRILRNGKILEDKKKYIEAINEYSKVNTFESYKRIIYCHRYLHDYENELKLIYDGINNSDFNKHEKRFFKRRLNRFFKNKNDYEEIYTEFKCPDCGSIVVLNKFKKRNKIKFFTCSNEKCYWFGGIKK